MMTILFNTRVSRSGSILWIVAVLLLVGCKEKVKDPSSPGKDQSPQVQNPPTPPINPPPVTAPPTHTPPNQYSRPSTVWGVRDRAKAMNDFRQAGQMLKNYELLNNRMPATVQAALAELRTISSVYKGIEEKSLIYLPTARGSSNSVVLYEYYAESGGTRLVLLGDGSVQRMTQDQLQAYFPRR